MKHYTIKEFEQMTKDELIAIAAKQQNVIERRDNMKKTDACTENCIHQFNGACKALKHAYKNTNGYRCSFFKEGNYKSDDECGLVNK